MNRSDSTDTAARAELTQRIVRAMRDGTPPDADAVKAMAETAPYFTAPAAALLASGADRLSEEERRRLEAQVALGSSDPKAIFTLTDPEGEMFADFYPDDNTSATPDTDSAIDTFLSAYGNMDPREAELIERLIFNPVADYSQVLARQEQAEHVHTATGPASETDDTAETATEATPVSTEARRQDELLDSFLSKYSSGAKASATPSDARADITEPTEKRPGEQASAAPGRPSKPRRAAQPPAPAPGALLSESLAAIYIKRGRYDKAYEIIHAISLNYPEKSIYFADQLRFLQKLMLNARARAARRDGPAEP